MNEMLESVEVADEHVVFCSRDNGSDIKGACKILKMNSVQCGAHCLNLIVKEPLKKQIKKRTEDENWTDCRDFINSIIEKSRNWQLL